jgi:hypothetical protein
LAFNWRKSGMGRLILNTEVVFLIGIFMLYCGPDSATAQEHLKKSFEASELDEILERFDDQPSKGQENKELDNVLEGFDDETEAQKEVNELDDVLRGFEEDKGAAEGLTKKDKRGKPPFWELSGSLSLGASFNFAHDAPKPSETDYRGLSRLRPELQLDLDLVLSKNWKALISGRGFYDLAYMINGRDEYTDEVLDEYEKEAEFGEVYLQGPLLANLDLKVGRQIVVWGKSDNIRVVDVLNPLDRRELGLVDIEDLRLPVTMTKLDYYFCEWNLSGVVVHEIRFNKEPAFGSDFYPSDSPLPHEEEPSEGFKHTEFGLALKGIFSGWDISFFGARFFDDQSHLEVVGPASPAGPPRLKRVHSRLTMLGAAANLAKGNWLFKTEAAYFDGLEFFNVPEKTKSRFDLLFGVEYSGFTETTITLEMVNRHLFNFDHRMENDPDRAEEDDFQTVLRFTRDFRNETIELTILASILGLTAENGAFERVSLKYDLTDDWSITGGVVLYQSGDNPMFSDIGNNDRLFLEIKYSF